MAASSSIEFRRGNLAILIDGDNAQPRLLGQCLLEAARYGRPTIRRIYGDWTADNMGGWKKILHEHAISPVQQFRNSVGKNATDCTMIIDAMDILNSRTVNAFCIVSSDSDYTRLAMRIREDGILVIGIGKQTTPQAFVKACDVFIRTELLGSYPEIETASAAAVPPSQSEKREVTGTQDHVKPTKSDLKSEKKTTAAVAASPKKPATPPLNMLQKAFDMSVQEDGRATLSAIGASLREIDPAFDPRTWGYAQLLQMITAANVRFQVNRPKGPTPGPIYVTLKQKAKTAQKAV